LRTGEEFLLILRFNDIKKKKPFYLQDDLNWIENDTLLVENQQRQRRKNIRIGPCIRFKSKSN